MNNIGPDCCDIILDYKMTFDIIEKQNTDIVDVINETYNDKSISKLNILWLDFKQLYKEKNIYNKSIRFTINFYGRDHIGNKKLFDLDLEEDCDDLFEDFTVISISKNVNSKTIIIALYNIKYDYDKLDEKRIQNTNVTYDSDVEITDANIDDFLV